MTDPLDLSMFAPLEGGGGKRFTVTTTSGSTAQAIPGTQALIGPLRVRVVNGGDVSAFIAFGQSTAVATTNHMEILPGTAEVFTVPDTRPSLLYVAARTASDSTTIQVTAGRGA